MRASGCRRPWQAAPAPLALLRKLAKNGDSAHQPQGPGTGLTPRTRSTQSELGIAPEGGMGQGGGNASKKSQWCNCSYPPRWEVPSPVREITTYTSKTFSRKEGTEKQRGRD